MKKVIILLFAACLTQASIAQSEKYQAAMLQNISKLDSIVVNNNAQELANNFTRIGDAEKNQWLPYYYASYATILQALMTQDYSKNDALADNARELLDKAEAVYGKDNSETNVIRSMIATAHMMVDPQNRYSNYGPSISSYIEKSKTQDPANPRPVLLLAQNTFYTPESFGGGKEAAKDYFTSADTLYKNFKPETELSPTWGGQSLEYFLSQYK
ncbi:hypothetical protein BH20BAC1_BH20BAC1_06750 [soil metagenome]